jgi:hypothetical protein
MASKKAIQDRILPEAPAPVRSAPKPKAAAPVKNRGAGAFYSPGDYSRRKGDLLGLRDVQKEFGPRVKSTPAPANYVKSRNLARLRALRDKPLSEQFTPAYYVTNPTDVPKQSMTVAQRMDLRNKILASQAAPKKQPAVAPAAPAKSGSSFGQAFAAARKAGQSTFTFGGKSYTTAMKGEARPATKKAAGTTRAATGGGKAQSSFGKAFASARAAGKSTFSFGGKSYTTAMKGGGGGGKASPASARANSSSRSTKTSSRGDVGAGRRGGGR